MEEKRYKSYTGSALTEWVENYRYQLADDLFSGKVAPPKMGGYLEDIAPYFPSDELKDAIEYARIIRRPLLLRGEPGCGKTRVAQAIAYELYHDRPNDTYRNHYFEWFIKSTTKAREGLYQFDHLARLRDTRRPEPPKSITTYRTFGPMGKAFLMSKPDLPAVLLIDEIDKAGLDFPNDLLLELDEKRFYIEETQEEIVAEYPPIVIITSNDEKELPNAFLRRCVFHYIDFPDEEKLLEIAQARIKRSLARQEIERALPESMITQITKQFYHLYQDMKANPNTDKVTSTSEFIDWLRVIQYHYLKGSLPLENGELPKDRLLFSEVLLKSLDDRKFLNRGN